MALDYDTLAARIPVLLMAQNRQWPGEIENTIRKGQERLLRSIHPDFLRQSLNGTLTEGADDLGQSTSRNVLNLAALSEFGELISLRVQFGGAYRTLLPRAYDYCAALYGSAEPARPKFYAEFTPAVFGIFPTPDEDMAYEAIANLKTPLISPNLPTNLLTEKQPMLLEYACALEGAIWMKDQSAVQIWQAALIDQLAIENDVIRRRRRDETTPTTRRTENAGGTP
jgi:hypothetical protein